MKRKIDEVTARPSVKRDASPSVEEPQAKRQRATSCPLLSSSRCPSDTSSPPKQVESDPYDLSSNTPLRLEYQDGYFHVTPNRVLDWKTGLGCVVNAKSDKWPDKELVVKIAWSAPGRQTEATCVSHIRERVSEKDAGWVLNHIPNLFHSQDFADASEAIMETGAPVIRQYALESDYPDDLALCVSVHEKLHTLSELKEVLEYGQVIFDALQVHRWIFDHAGILHRDISEGNMGTPLYMAQEQHENPPMPLYRHELESFFYVLLILANDNLLEQPKIDETTKTACYLAPDPESPYLSWRSDDHEFLSDTKGEFWKAERPYTHPSFDVLAWFIHDLWMQMCRGKAAKSKHRRHCHSRKRILLSPQENILPYDESALGGHWTLDVRESLEGV